LPCRLLTRVSECPATAKHCFFQKKALTKVRTYGLIANVSARQNGPHGGGTTGKKLKSGKLKSGNPDFCRRQRYRLKTNSSEFDQIQVNSSEFDLSKITTRPNHKVRILFLYCNAIRQHRAYPGRSPIGHFTEKMQSQGNKCQGNGKKRFQDYSPDNHSPDICPAFSIRHPPSWLWLRLAALDCNSGESSNSNKILTAKNAETRTYVVFSLRSVRSLWSIHLWLRRAALGLMRIFAANHRKCLSMNHLRAQRDFSNQAQSRQSSYSPALTVNRRPHRGFFRPAIANLGRASVVRRRHFMGWLPGRNIWNFFLESGGGGR